MALDTYPLYPLLWTEKLFFLVVETLDGTGGKEQLFELPDLSGSFLTAKMQSTGKGEVFFVLPELDDHYVHHWFLFIFSVCWHMMIDPYKFLSHWLHAWASSGSLVSCLLSRWPQISSSTANVHSRPYGVAGYLFFTVVHLPSDIHHLLWRNLMPDRNHLQRLRLVGLFQSPLPVSCSLERDSSCMTSLQ